MERSVSDAVVFADGMFDVHDCAAAVTTAAADALDLDLDLLDRLVMATELKTLEG